MEIRKTEVFARWVDGLRAMRVRGRVLARIERLAAGNPGDVAPVGEGVSELRIDDGPGYRVYFNSADAARSSRWLGATRVPRRRMCGLR